MRNADPKTGNRKPETPELETRNSKLGTRGPAAALAALSALLLSASAAPAQEVRVSRIDVKVGFDGCIRMERWVPIWVKVQAKGPDDTAVQVEVVDRDLDGDRVHYRRSTFVRELRSRDIEVYFRPRLHGGAHPDRHDFSVVVRDEQTREVLARENFSHSVNWSLDTGSALSTILYGIDPNRRLIAFLDTGGPEFKDKVGMTGSFEEFLKLFDEKAHLAGTPPGASFAAPRVVGEAATRRFARVDLTEDDLPSAGFALEALDAIVWAPGGRENLSQARRRALAEWVAAGGRLIVFTGRTWIDVRNNFPARPITPNPGETDSPAPTGLLPVSFGPDPAAPQPDDLFLKAMRGFLGADGAKFPAVNPDTQKPPTTAVAPMTVRPASESVGFSQVRSWGAYTRADRPELAFALVVEARFGAGSVTTVGFNPNDPALKPSPPAKPPEGTAPPRPPAPMALFWKHLLHRVGLAEPLREVHAVQWGGDGGEQKHAHHLLKADLALDRALEDFRLAGLGAGTMLLLLIVYGILVGPAMWFALKATNLLRWSWPIFAVLVIGSTVLAYTMVTLFRGVRTHRNRITVVDIPAEGGAVSGWHLESVYSPLDGRFRLTPPGPHGWIAPWSPNDADAADIGPDLAGDAYFENFNPGGNPAVELAGVPIRNHLKKFVSRWFGGKPVGRLDVRRLHVTFDDPALTSLAEPLSSRGFWEPEDRSGRAAEAERKARGETPFHFYRHVARVDFEVRNNLDFDVQDALLLVWPHEAGGAPEMIVAHARPPAGFPNAVSLRDCTAGAGAVVVSLKTLTQGGTVRGIAGRAAADGTPAVAGATHTAVPLRDWLAGHASRFPVTGGYDSTEGFRMDDAGLTTALLSIQRRLCADPAIRDRWNFGARAAEEDVRAGRWIKRAPDEAPASGRRSLAVRVGSASFLDLSAGMRPDEALLIGRADGEVKLPLAVIQTAGGSNISPVERSSVIVRSRLPFTSELRLGGSAPRPADPKDE